MIVRSRDQKSAHRGFGRGALYLGGGACLLLVRSFFKLHGLCPFLPPGFACTPVTGSRVMRGGSAEQRADRSGPARHSPKARCPKPRTHEGHSAQADTAEAQADTAAKVSKRTGVQARAACPGFAVAAGKRGPTRPRPAKRVETTDGTATRAAARKWKGGPPGRAVDRRHWRPKYLIGYGWPPLRLRSP